MLVILNFIEIICHSAAEMKAIINMDDLLKKNTYKLDVSSADNEDLTSKLEVRRPSIFKWNCSSYCPSLSIFFSLLTSFELFDAFFVLYCKSLNSACHDHISVHLI